MPPHDTPGVAFRDAEAPGERDETNTRGDGGDGSAHSGVAAVIHRHRTALAVAALIAVLVLPLAVAAVALHRPWYPVLDLAMTELRVRDVGGVHTPLIGLPGRIGNFPKQGSHPGPLSFYALAPVYRLLGSSSWGLLASALFLNAIAIGATVVVAARHGGIRLAVVISAMVGMLTLGYGIGTLSQPWNPYMPLLFWLLALVCVWSVLAGDVALLPVAVVAASFAAQTHVPYLGLCVGMAALVTASLVWQARHAPARSGARRSIARWSVASVVLAGVLWAPVVVDQLIRDPGNLSMLWHHFTSPPEKPVGFGKGLQLVLLHLDVVGFVGSRGGADGSLVRASSDPSGSVVPGVIVLAVWLGSVVAAWRARLRDVLRLDLVIALALALALYSMARIFGKVWYYLMLWAWGITALVVLAVISTIVLLAARRLGARAREQWARAGIAVAVAVTVGSSALLTARAADAVVPADRLSTTIGAVLPPTVRALEAGTNGATGHRGTYLVTWSDAFYFGSQGYGVLSELERRGYHVGALDPWHVPVTPQRVLAPSQATAQVHFATGRTIDEWRAKPGAVEVAYFDPRTPAEHAEFDRLRARVRDELTRDGLSDDLDLVDGNLFGATLDTRVPAATRKRMERMLYLGQPGAMFIAPASLDT